MSGANTERGDALIAQHWLSSLPTIVSQGLCHLLHCKDGTSVSEWLWHNCLVTPLSRASERSFSVLFTCGVSCLSVSLQVMHVKDVFCLLTSVLGTGNTLDLVELLIKVKVSLQTVHDKH